MRKILFAIVLLFGSFSSSAVSAWHGDYHPSYERVPKSGHGPLLPDPNQPYYELQRQQQQQRQIEQQLQIW